jgi:hypothetical protein
MTEAQHQRAGLVRASCDAVLIEGAVMAMPEYPLRLCTATLYQPNPPLIYDAD